MKIAGSARGGNELVIGLGHEYAPAWGSGAHLGAGASVGGKVHNIWWFHDPTNGSKRYVFVGEEGPGTGAFGTSSSGDIHVVDISDIANPREVACYSVSGAGTHNSSFAVVAAEMDDPVAQACVGCEDAVVAVAVDAGRRDEAGERCEKREG